MNATKNATKTTIILGLLLLTGVLLRIYQLGVDSFWIDEIGVAYAARQATLQEMFQAMDNHIMAVPLDYIVAWLFARVNASEAFLRLPAVMWGIAALPVGYSLFSRLSGRSVALLSTGLLAVSPLHVQYSQELRFYAALVFFYLLSSLLLLRAIQNPASGIRDWIIYTFIAIIGMYFHIYVLLVLVNGVAWLWLTPDSRQTHSIQKIYFIRSAAILLVAFLLSVLLFGSVNMSVEIPLLLHGDSFLQVLGVALGWLPFYSVIPVLPWIFGGLCFVFAVIGMAASIAKAPRGPASVLIFSLAAQIAGIILMNYLKNYFLAPRQFLFALPFMLYYTAFGVQLVAERLALPSRRSLPIFICSVETFKLKLSEK